MLVGNVEKGESKTSVRFGGSAQPHLVASLLRTRLNTICALILGESRFCFCPISAEAVCESRFGESPRRAHVGVHRLCPSRGELHWSLVKPAHTTTQCGVPVSMKVFFTHLPETIGSTDMTTACDVPPNLFWDCRSGTSVCDLPWTSERYGRTS